MAVLVVYALIWFLGVQKINPFRPVPMSLINDGATLDKLDAYVEKEKIEKAERKMQKVAAKKVSE